MGAVKDCESRNLLPVILQTQANSAWSVSARKNYRNSTQLNKTVLVSNDNSPGINIRWLKTDKISLLNILNMT